MVSLERASVRGGEERHGQRRVHDASVSCERIYFNVAEKRRAFNPLGRVVRARKVKRGTHSVGETHSVTVYAVYGSAIIAIRGPASLPELRNKSGQRFGIN